MAHQGYGFCEFLTEEDAEYACKIMNQIKLWGKPIRVNKVSLRMRLVEVHSHSCYAQASSDKKQLDVGANLFIGNLDENVDERLLYDTFSAFGMMATTAKVRVKEVDSMSELTHAIDCARPWHRCFKGLRLCLIHRLRGFRRRNRVHERPVPHEQSHHRAICFQKRRQRRASRYLSGTSTRSTGTEEQRASRRRPPASCADGFWCSASHARIPGSLSRAIRRRARPTTTSAWFQPAADGRSTGDANDGRDATCRNAASTTKHGNVSSWRIPATTTAWFCRAKCTWNDGSTSSTYSPILNGKSLVNVCRLSRLYFSNISDCLLVCVRFERA
jgi:hypothetical protein